MTVDNKVQVGDTTTGAGTSTTWHCPYTQPKAEQGWECPRCGRINAPWVRQCDCSRNNASDWTYPPWWREITCTSDTSHAHPDPTIHATNVTPVVGGSDYKDSLTGDWINAPKTYTNSGKR